jgi:hypothetical protein
MVKDISTEYHSCTLQAPLPETAVLVIGAGHFGERAIRMLKDIAFSPIFVVDKERKNLERIQASSVQKVLCNGVCFLKKNISLLHPSMTIVPAIPLHLAFEWLESTLKQGQTVHQVPVPGEIRSALPHTWNGSEGSLLVSYADFKCPDNCPEPEEYCTVTKKRRGLPLYDLLGKTAPNHFTTHIIRSRQLAPGLGGYKVGDLISLLERVRKEGKRKWLVGTACKCHGTVTALEIR